MTEQAPVLSGGREEGSQTSLQALLLRNAQAMNLHLTSSHESVSRVCENIYTRLRQGSTGRDRYKAKRLKCIQVIVLNLFAAYSQDKKRYIRYSRHAENYKFGRYNPQGIGFKVIRNTMDALKANGYLKHKMGIPFADDHSSGRQSRVRASRVLQARFKSFQMQMVERVEVEEVIVLKEKKDASGRARYMDYEDTAETVEMRANLWKINAHLSTAHIGLYVSDDKMRSIAAQLQRDPRREPIDFRRTKLRRIFNDGKWTHGGRFYSGWWQEIPKSARDFIVINGQSTVEFDYSGIHIAIFYAKAGREMPSTDPYALEHVPERYRNLVKRSLNIMINAATKPKAQKAITKRYSESDMPPAYPGTSELIDAISRKHDPIRKFFCSGRGVWAQYVDSQIAEKILLELGRDGVIVLPIHDSFVVERTKVGQLKRAMARAFPEIVNATCGKHQRMPIWETIQDKKPDRTIRRDDDKHRQRYSGYYGRELSWQQQRNAGTGTRSGV